MTYKKRTYHGASRTPEYAAWNSMIHRCYVRSDKAYPKYGGRGITVCPEWRESVLNFISDMGPRPKGHVLDRIDSNKNYCAENCRWATWDQSNQNKRNNIVVTFRGEKIPLTEAIKLVKSPVSYRSVVYRVRKGWRIEQALTALPIIRNQHTKSQVQRCR